MAEHYRFFNSAEGDIREYTAAEFAEYFSRFLSDGLYTEEGKAGLQVTAAAQGLMVDIASGYAFVRGYMYRNDSTISQVLSPADTTLQRIDRVVLRFDEVAREIRVTVKEGAFSSTPQPPGLEIAQTVKELALAQVRIKAGASSLALADITDERLTSACGLVSSLIDIPAQEMWDVWNQALGAIESAWASQTAGIDQDWGTQSGDIDDEWGDIKSAWQQWFAAVQGTLGARLFSGPTEPADIQIDDIWLKEV